MSPEKALQKNELALRTLEDMIAQFRRNAVVCRQQAETAASASARETMTHLAEALEASVETAMEPRRKKLASRVDKQRKWLARR